jgi:hypothetical protein
MAADNEPIRLTVTMSLGLNANLKQLATARRKQRFCGKPSSSTNQHTHGSWHAGYLLNHELILNLA